MYTDPPCNLYPSNKLNFELPTKSNSRKTRVLLTSLALLSWIVSTPSLKLSATPDNRIAKLLPDRQQLVIKPYVLGLENPWGMAFLPNGDLLVTEKSGALRLIRKGKLEPNPIAGVPNIWNHGQGGLLDIGLHPDFADNQLLYLSFAYQERQSSVGSTAILRARFENNALEDVRILYKGQPSTSAGHHFGSRLTFDSENFLYFSIGDRGQRDTFPQDLSQDGGKIYRIHDDGKIPTDNPFLNTPGAKPAIYSYGHRNPQGLTTHPSTGKIWSHEHGPKGGDELNLILPGRNYGWPVISYGRNYSGTSFTDLVAKEGMEQPITHWTPSIAPCGMSFIEGGRYPGWEGNLVLGSLKFGYLVRVELKDEKVLRQEKIASGIGRARNVVQGPDGLLYVGVEGRGIFKLLPK